MIGQSMRKNLNLVCEAKLSLEKSGQGASPSGKIEARVTTWGAREGADGRKFNYQPEGFKDWAESFKEAGKPLPMFLNHNDMGMPVGQWNEFNFDASGMTAEGQLFLNTVGGSDIYNVLKESPNLFGGVSVGAYADEARMVNAEGDDMEDDDDQDEGYFQITKGGLQEVSIVMYPNNPAAEVMKLEYFNADGHANPRIIEKALRDAGLRRKDATTASSILKKILEQRDVTPKIPEGTTPQKRDAEAVVNEADLLKALEMRELEKALSKRIKLKE
jgi:HK97 family phage prohead protease